MPKRKIRVISCIPGAVHLKPIIHSFLETGPGWVTSFSDGRLKWLATLAGSHAEAVRPYIEIVGEYLTRLHIPKLPLAQAGHVRAAVVEACLALPEDSVFAAAARFPGAHRKIASALSELRDWGLDADDLAETARQMPGTLGDKLKSLSFVEREVSESLRSIARERGADRLTASISFVGETTDLGRLLVVAGSDVTNRHVSWLNWAHSEGAEITLIVDGSDGRLFRDLSAAVQRLDAKIERAGLPNALQSRLFRPEVGAEPPPSSHLKVRIESAADSLAEAEWTMRSISADLEDGLNLDEIAIFCRDPEGYMPLLDAASTRLQVPISCIQRRPLLGNSFARFVLCIMRFCAGDDVRALGTALRSSYLRLDPTSIEAAETQLKRAFGERENQWTVLEAWTKEAPDSTSWLAPMLEWRARYLHHPAPLHAWYDRLRELGQQSWRDQALDGAAQTSSRDGYAESAMLRGLAQYASIDRVRGAKLLNLRQFVATCARIWESADVSALSDPSAVQVVSSTAQLSDVRSLYVLGLLEGVFPRRRSEDPILADVDRAELSGHFPDRLPLPDSHSKALRERDEFFRLCGATTDKLVLSYPQTEDDRDNVRAFYLGEVERALPGQIEYVNHPRQSLTPSIPVLAADKALLNSFAVFPLEQPLPNCLETEQAKAAVSGSAARHVTPRALGDVLECPFRYVAESVLKLSPNRRRSRWHHLFRLPARTGLASLPFRETADRALRLALEDELNSLMADATQDDLAMMRAGGERMIGEWLDREFGSRFLWPRESIVDKPSFEHGHLRSKMKADDGDVFLFGEFPALSERNGYRILHLFRASEPWSDSRDRLDDPWERLSEREAFELGLYLAALYTPTQSRVGIEIDSASGARNLFLLPRPEESPRSDQARSYKVTIIDDDRRPDLFKQVRERMQVALRRIKQAMVEATSGEHCLNCDYGELCRRSFDYGEEVDPFGQNDSDDS